MSIEPQYKFTKSVLSLLLVVMPAYGQDATVESIKLLESSRTEVEKLIKSTSEDKGDIVTYLLSNSKLLVTYSMGQCNEDKRAEWDVPRGIVTAVSYYPNTKTLLSPRISGEYTRRATEMPRRFVYKH